MKMCKRFEKLVHFRSIFTLFWKVCTAALGCRGEDGFIGVATQELRVRLTSQTNQNNKNTVKIIEKYWISLYFLNIFHSSRHFCF